MANNRTQQQNLESSPPSAESARKRIRIDDPSDVTFPNITTTASYQQYGQLPHGEPVAPSARAHWIPSVEDALLVLKKRRLEEGQQPVYIPPMAKANLQTPDDKLFLLMEKVQEFFVSECEVMLILGDSGAGKSTFNRHLEHCLWTNYIDGSPIPLFINLPEIREPEEDMVVKQLRNHNFTEDQIREMKQHRQFILICDGYDESQLDINLHKTNRLNQRDQWYAKMVISCRSQFLGPEYSNRFAPQSSDHYKPARLDLFQETVIAPFSKNQVEDYVTRYVPLEPRTWTTQDYMQMLTTIPNLMDLVKNPFLLTLSLEALPEVIKDHQDLSTVKITRVQLYDCFVVQWLRVNMRRLQDCTLSKDDHEMLEHLVAAGFASKGISYSRDLAVAIFEQHSGIPVVEYIHLHDDNTWKKEYFGPQAKARLLRESSPMARTGNLHQFLHRSLLEYFFSRAVFEPPSCQGYYAEFSPQVNPDCSVVQSLDPYGPLFTCNLIAEPSVIQFLCERAKQHPDFEKQLLAVVEQSKIEPTAATAAANAITILVRAGVRFNGADLRGIRIPGADLSDSQLDSAQLQDADLTGVTFAGSWLRQANLNGAKMDGVRFGELPFLKVKGGVSACAYSPDGRMLAVSAYVSGLSIYDTTAWNRAYQHPVDGTRITCVAFSPNSQQLVYGTAQNIVRLWSIVKNDIVWDMVGHAESVKSVAFSPCGKQCASASKDKSVRLWSSETGECLFVLQGHADVVTRIAYCADGKRFVSVSGREGMILVWNSDTGEAVACWDTEQDHCIALSANGQWVAVALLLDSIHITNAVTGEPGPVLNKREFRCAAISLNGQWVVTSRLDGSLCLWDILSGFLISSFSGHAHMISSCTFSPSGFQIASGDPDGYVRLWEVDTSRAISGLDRPIGPVSTLTYSPDGLSILVGSDSQGVQQWDSQTGVPAPLSLKMDNDVLTFSLSPDDNQIATGHRDGAIRLWSRQADIAECTLLGYANDVIRLAYSPCGRWIISANWVEAPDRGEVRLWDLHTNQHPGVIAQIEASEVFRCAFTPTGQIVVRFDGDTLHLYDPRAQETCKVLKEISMYFEIFSLDCSPDGQELAIGSDDGKVYLWDYQSDKPCIELEGHNGTVLCVAYSPCGRRILSSSNDKTVRIWRFRTGDISSWSCITVIGGINTSILAWNPIVTTLEFVASDTTVSVRVWRIANHDDGDEGDVSVKMLWSNDVGLLCTSDLTFKDTVGLSPINQKLLVQRGAKRDHL